MSPSHRESRVPFAGTVTRRHHLPSSGYAVFQMSRCLTRRNEHAASSSADTVFLDVELYLSRPHYGIILVRLLDMKVQQLVEVVIAAINQLDEQDLAGTLIVIEKDLVRIRRKPS